MVSKLTTGKIQTWLGGILSAFSAAGIIASLYPAVKIINSLLIFELSSWVIMGIMGIILILEGLANIAEL
jgi:hypothetical protein